MPDYSYGKIYRIESNQCEKFYIGSTTEKRLCRRLSGHMTKYKIYQAGKCNYYSSFEILQHNDARIVLIENFPCKSKDELHAREEHYLRAHKDHIINKYAAFQTDEDKKNYDKEHHIANRDKRLEQMKACNSQPVQCEYCNRSYRKDNYYAHVKSAKHIHNEAHIWDLLEALI